jgi:hypothetical protein
LAPVKLVSRKVSSLIAAPAQCRLILQQRVL